MAAADGVLRASGCLHLFVQGQGPGEIVQGAWSVSLGPDDVALYLDGCRPSMPEGTGLQSLMCFFLAGVFPVQEGVLRLLPVVLPGGHPATSLLLRVAGSLCHDTEEQSSSLPPHFLGGFLSMLAGTLESQRQAPTGLQRLPPVHLPRIKAHLREHLRQPGLTVDSVARALGLSVSQVHRVFAHEGCTVSEWLWRERLEGCAGELAHASEARRTVGEIALSWGFNDLSHFSYAFKKRYGMSPKEWRDQAR